MLSKYYYFLHISVCSLLIFLVVATLCLLFIYYRDMKITLESYCKRAAALYKKEPDIPKLRNTLNINQKAELKIKQNPLLAVLFDYFEDSNIRLTNALSKVRYPAAPVKSWQSYNDTRMGVRWSRRSMVHFFAFFKLLNEIFMLGYLHSKLSYYVHQYDH